MDDVNNLVDYYEILECERTATFEELKRSYQRLVLNSHPDKIEDKGDNNSFILIQKAWSVLKDPDSRKQYDALLSCQEHSECLLYDTIGKSEMQHHHCGNDMLVYPCRCGGTYVLDASDYIPSVIIIECDECSFSIKVNGAS